MFYLIIGLVAGFLLAIQNPINAKLGKTLDSPFRASFISFSLGLIFLTFIAFIQNPNFLSSIFNLFQTKQPWWTFTAGIFSLLYLTSNILLFPKVGAVQTVVLPTLGQVLMSVAIETFGWFDSKIIPMDFARFIGVLITIVGIFITVALGNRSKKEQEEVKKIDKNESEEQLIGWRIWGVIAGSLASIQQAVTGHLGKIVGSPVVAALIAFALAWVLILIFVSIKERPFISVEKLKKAPWWSLIGGIPGSLFVFFIGMIFPIVGTGMAAIMGLIGTLIGTIIVQQFGWFKSLKKKVNLIQIAGILIMLAGVVVIRLF